VRKCAQCFESFLLAILVLPALCSPLAAQTVMDTQAETGLAEAHPQGWWPNEGAVARNAYAGPRACAPCHPSEFSGWKNSQMAHAIMPAAESPFLRAHPRMSYQRGPYTYRIDLSGGQAVYSVTDGQNTLSIALLWAYGTGVVGQAYVFRANGVYNEAEVAFYPVLGRLDIVAGLVRALPPTLQLAFGLPLIPAAAQQCISCHTTAAVAGGRLDVQTLIRGVTCEACHGPGARHVAAMEKAGRLIKPAATNIFDPVRLDPADLENFCAACHRSSLLVEREGLHGLDTVHYEPYRLEMSQCWIMSQRLTCITCHNPHQPLQQNPVGYDSACLSCHSARPSSAMALPAAKTCPVAARNCVTCHMPECRLPLSPFSLSDHFIRIVSAGDPCAKS
jgi:hypothetical protein